MNEKKDYIDLIKHFLITETKYLSKETLVRVYEIMHNEIKANWQEIKKENEKKENE